MSVERLGPNDVIAPGAFGGGIKRQRVPLKVYDADGVPTEIGEADAWVENGEIRIEGTINDPKWADQITGGGFGPRPVFTTPTDFYASIPFQGEPKNGPIPRQERRGRHRR